MTDDLRWGTIEPTGWTTWTALTPHLAGLTCAWAGLDGFHVEPAPTTLPITTHLWAWRSGRWLRARIDGERITAGHLRLHDNLDDPTAEPILIRHALTWRPSEDRVADLPTHVLRGDWILLEATGQRPITFVGDAHTLPTTPP